MAKFFISPPVIAYFLKLMQFIFIDRCVYESFTALLPRIVERMIFCWPSKDDLIVMRQKIFFVYACVGRNRCRLPNIKHILPHIKMVLSPDYSYA